MVKYFDCSIVNLAQKKIISGSVENKIKGYEVQLDQFRKEIEWWFALYQKTSVLHKFNVKKPIVIEMYEFANYLSKTLKQITAAVHIINKIYKLNNRDYPIIPIEKSTKTIISKCEKVLRPLRNQIAAHRYTTGREKKFLRIVNYFELHNNLSIKNLNKCKRDLFQSHDRIKSWLLNPVNRRNLIIGDKH